MAQNTAYQANFRTNANTVTSVNAAFSEFMTNCVNLDPAITQEARSSRNWLLEQIHALPAKHDDFPPLFTEKDIHYGSFARRTKIRELDDIDLIICMKAMGCTYYDSNGRVIIYVPDGIQLRALCNDGQNTLNSRRVINHFVKHLSDIPQYDKADLGRNGSAAVLNLKSYTWSFDIVPGFFTSPEFDGRTYYIIPDGNGEWMKTDPRLDQSRVTKINQDHGGNVLNAVRLIKYWSRRATMPSMTSYLLECMILDHYETRSNAASSYVDCEVKPILDHIASAVYESVQDPKGIQGDINNLDWYDAKKISDRALADAEKASEARSAESGGDHKESIRLWKSIFGPNFPDFG